jgi:hypothetical protein
MGFRAIENAGNWTSKPKKYLVDEKIPKEIPRPIF